jgi:hypothetical protein
VVVERGEFIRGVRKVVAYEFGGVVKVKRVGGGFEVKGLAFGVRE